MRSYLWRNTWSFTRSLFCRNFVMWMLNVECTKQVIWSTQRDYLRWFAILREHALAIIYFAGRVVYMSIQAYRRTPCAVYLKLPNISRFPGFGVAGKYVKLIVKCSYWGVMCQSHTLPKWQLAQWTRRQLPTSAWKVRPIQGTAVPVFRYTGDFERHMHLTGDAKQTWLKKATQKIQRRSWMSTPIRCDCDQIS